MLGWRLPWTSRGCGIKFVSLVQENSSLVNQAKRSSELYLLLIKVWYSFVGTCWFLGHPLYSDHDVKLQVVPLLFHQVCKKLISATGCFSVLPFGMLLLTLFYKAFPIFRICSYAFFFSMTNQESLTLIITWTGIVYRMFCWSASLLVEVILFICKLRKNSSSQVANLVLKAVRSRTSAVPLWVRLCSLGSVASSNAFKHVLAHFFQVLWCNCCASSVV